MNPIVVNWLALSRNASAVRIGVAGHPGMATAGKSGGASCQVLRRYLGDQGERRGDHLDDVATGLDLADRDPPVVHVAGQDHDRVAQPHEGGDEPWVLGEIGQAVVHQLPLDAGLAAEQELAEHEATGPVEGRGPGLDGKQLGLAGEGGRRLGPADPGVGHEERQATDLEGRRGPAGRWKAS